MIRQATEADYDALVGLYTGYDRAITEHLGNHAALRDKKQKGEQKAVFNALHNGRGKIFVARESEEYLGFIYGFAQQPRSAIFDLPKMGTVKWFFVSDQARRKGLGAALYQALEEWFREQGCAYAQVDATHADFYASQGFDILMQHMKKKL